ncbi:MAG: sulfatase-like hydrolase/transferase [Bacteroidota bacterium]
MNQYKRPNILIFMTDQEQAQVTLSGHPCLTPTLDRVAREGIRFTSAYPPMAHCCPSRASFMTGLYPSQHGIHNNVLNEQAIGRSLRPGVRTFSEMLRQAGYRMFFSGKWHVSATETPADRGWEELHVTASIHEYHGSRRDTFKAMDYRQTETPRKRGELRRPGWGPRPLYGTAAHGYAEDGDYIVVKKAVDRLARLKESPDPWCMYVGVKGPHDPFVVPEKYARMYDPGEIPLPPNYHDDLRDKPAVYRRMRKVFSQLTEDEVKESIAHYWGYCSMMDDLFSEVLTALEDSGQKDDTLVIFLSDHGEHCGAHGLYAKGLSAFDEGYRVPCVMRWPAFIDSPGRSVDAFVTLMDIAPTLIEIAGAEKLPACAGESLVPFLAGEMPGKWREEIFAQCNGVEVYHTSRMIRTKEYKFVYHPTDIDELYDLEHDPHELHNLADRPEAAPIKEELYRLMWENAFRYEDTIFNPYLTVATADFGPALVNK